MMKGISKAGFAEEKEMKNLSPFCTCTDFACPMHPSNHDKGCAPCIAKNLGRREIPACFFNKVDSVKEHTTFYFEDFAESVLRCRNAEVPKGAFMELEKLPHDLSVCKLSKTTDIDLNHDFYFIGRTDEELSLVCPTKDVPANTVKRDDGWKGFRIRGVLDFSLVGILSGISRILAENKIGIFAVSTFQTDYILVREKNFDKAASVLAAAGYTVV